MNKEVLFSTGKDDWETPDEVFNYFNSLYHFNLDAAANATNHKTPTWFGEQADGTFVNGLVQDWSGKTIWLNPPYSNPLQKNFIQKALEAASEDSTVVCLLPARTDTHLWHNFVMRADEVYFIKGRLQFKGAEASAPFPSCVVVFRNGQHNSPRFFSLDKKTLK